MQKTSQIDLDTEDGREISIKAELADGECHGACTVADTNKHTVLTGNYVAGKLHGPAQLQGTGLWKGRENSIFWMGKNLNKSIRKLDDGSKMYLCSDEVENGVSVAIMSRASQQGLGYPLKNGYILQCHFYKNEIGVAEYQNGRPVSFKWYQLKK